MAETLDKNMVDKDEYPQTAELERRCVNILAELWHAADATGATGTARPSARSEAAMLGGMALLWRWRARRTAAGRPTDAQPRHRHQRRGLLGEVLPLLGGRAPRVPMEGDRSHLDAEQAAAACDENTIGVVAVLGWTFDGSYEPVAGSPPRSTTCGRRRARRPDPRRRRVGRLRGAVHPARLGGTSGSRACSGSTPRATSTASCIPASGGRCGATPTALPEELVFRVDYLGGEMPTFALNFSRPGSQVRPVLQVPPPRAQRLRAVQRASQEVALGLRRRREAGALRAADRRQRAAGVRLPDARGRQVHGLRGLAPAA